MTSTVTINGIEYALDDLSKTAKDMLRNIEAADRRLQQLKQETAMISIARRFYAQTLAENLPPARAAASVTVN